MDTIQLIARLGFWVCTGLVLYTYALYPVLIWWASRRVRPGEMALGDEQADLPTVSVLIAAYNEEAVIEQRIVNALALHYPADRIEIVIASDGSSDGTAGIVRRYAGSGVRLLEYTARRGKTTVLNDAVSSTTGQIIMLSDANTFFEPTAARALVRWFADPSVGTVCGALKLIDHATGKNADGMYWRYETFLKRCEGKLGALLGSNGAIYAVRKDIFPKIPNGTIVDDFVIPLLVKLKTGCRIVYEPEAIATEEVAPAMRDEFRRRTRIGAGGYQAIGMLWRLLNPSRGWIALSFFSHKVLRWLCPFFLLVAFACSMILWRELLYQAALLGQVCLFLVAPALTWMPGHGPVIKVVRLASMFTLMNAALLVGFLRWAHRRQTGVWVRTLRAAELPDVG